VKCDQALSITAAAGELANGIGLIIDDRSYSFGELAEAIKSLSVKTILRAESTLEVLLNLYAALEHRVGLTLLHPAFTQAECEALATVQADTENVLAVLFTSGSAGTPKGVILTREAFFESAQASAENLGWEEKDRWLLNLPLSHVGGLSVVIRCLIARKTVVVASDFLAASTRHRVTLASLVPTQLIRLIGSAPPKSLRAVLIGGAPLSPKLRQEAVKARWPVLSSYGMTETCSQIATWPNASFHPTNQSAVGRILPGVDARVHKGELQVRGPMLFAGYLAEKPRKESDWFSTGDLAHIDEDNWLSVTGRLSDIIISGGENIHPLEIENCLAQAPGVDAVSVLGVASEQWGEAVCVAYTGAAKTTELRAFSKRHLASYKQPKTYLNVTELPLSSNGKVNKEALAVLLSSTL
jgi:o-succinylbenzoate---CoA ligase